MQATIRRYEGVDAARTNELVERVNETLVPQLRELHGFSGYYLIDAGDGVISSVSLFETLEQAEESTKLVSKWIRDETSTRRFPTLEDHKRRGRERPDGRRRPSSPKAHLRALRRAL
jgi:hypothetical protein